MKYLITIFCVLSLSLAQAQPNFDLVGFATQNGGTTGGAGGQTVRVSSYNDLKNYAESSGPYIIMVEGTISNGSGGGLIRIASNKSIIGVGDNAYLSGIGLDISDPSNIIVQNLKISLVGTSNPKSINDGDCISISGSSRNIWIDHCELFSEDPSVQTDIDKYDGLVDIKGETGFITLSWNYFHDHHKGGLVGASDSDLYADRKITYHHNYYQNVRLRVPMFRGGTGHFFNNYIVGARDATEIRANTCVRVEKNYYEALHYSIYTTSDSPGKTERIDNIEVDRTSRAYPAHCTADIPYDYASVLTNDTEQVKTVVPQYAGVGKIPQEEEDCSGTVGGGASIDQCGECTGGQTGLIPDASCTDCNGEFEGSAYFDDCGVCIGGNSENLPCTGSMEAENACEVDGILLEKAKTGFSGAGYVNTDNALGSAVSWIINSDVEQSATLTFRFANEGPSNRDGKILINNVSAGQLKLPGTGNRTRWEQVSINVDLQAGSNELRLEATTADGLANLDVIHFSASVSDGQCVVTSTKGEIISENLAIYPNPGSGEVHFNKTTKWVLMNTQGKQLDKGKSININLSAYPEGLYYIKTRGKNFKLIKN